MQEICDEQKILDSICPDSLYKVGEIHFYISEDSKDLRLVNSLKSWLVESGWNSTVGLNVEYVSTGQMKRVHFIRHLYQTNPSLSYLLGHSDDPEVVDFARRWLEEII